MTQVDTLIDNFKRNELTPAYRFIMDIRGVVIPENKTEKEMSKLVWFFLSLKPKALDVYLWCKDFGRFKGDKELFFSLETYSTAISDWKGLPDENNLRLH